MLKRQRWLEVVGGAQHQRQEHRSYSRLEEETGDERGESTCLVEGWKLKEQKRQMRRIMWVRRKERNPGKVERRKRNREVNANRNSNKAKRRWCRHQLGDFQSAAELEGCVEQSPGSRGWAACSGASEAPPNST